MTEVADRRITQEQLEKLLKHAEGYLAAKAEGVYADAEGRHWESPKLTGCRAGCKFCQPVLDAYDGIMFTLTEILVDNKPE